MGFQIWNANSTSKENIFIDITYGTCPVERILSQNVYVWFSEVYLSPQVDFEEIDIFTASFVGQPKDGVEI